MVKTISLLLAIMYTTTLLVASLIRTPSTIETPENTDKVLHFTAYFILAILWYYVGRMYQLNPKKSAVITSIFAISLGILLEFLQSYCTQSRVFDTYDILANTIGAIVGILVAIKIKLKKILSM